MTDNRSFQQFLYWAILSALIGCCVVILTQNIWIAFIIGGLIGIYNPEETLQPKVLWEDIHRTLPKKSVPQYPISTYLKSIRNGIKTTAISYIQSIGIWKTGCIFIGAYLCIWLVNMLQIIFEGYNSGLISLGEYLCIHSVFLLMIMGFIIFLSSMLDRINSWVIQNSGWSP